MFFSSGRRVRELGTWSLQVYWPNSFLVPRSQVLIPPKAAGFNGQGEKRWVGVLGFRPQGRVVMEVVGRG